MKVHVKYAFIFDPVDTWQNMYQLDATLAEFLRTKGLQAEIVKTQTGQEQVKMLFISKLPSDMASSSEEPEEKTIKQVKADLTKGRGYDGRFK